MKKEIANIDEANRIYNKFLKKTIKEGYAHKFVNCIVGIEKKAVFTEAEVKAGKDFWDWMMEDVVPRGNVTGGKTYKFTIKNNKIILIPEGLARSRLYLNSHLWEDGGYKVV